MSKTSNKERYIKFIDRLLSNKTRRYYTHEEIIEYLFNKDNREVSRKTIRSIQNYLKEMKNGFYPIASEEKVYCEIEEIRIGQKKGFRYSDSDFKLYSNNLSLNTLQRLSIFLKYLKEINAGTLFENLLYDIENELKENEEFSLVNDKKIIHLDNNFLIDLENSDVKEKFINQIYNSINENKRIKMVYKPYNSEKVTLSLSPYLIKEYNNRWFLIAFQHESSSNCHETKQRFLDRNEKINIYPFDRIKKIEFEEKEFKPSTLDFNDIYENTIGVSIIDFNNLTEEKIKFKVNESSLNYIKTKPIHSSQKQLHDGSFQICVYNSNELKYVLLSLSSYIEVLEPRILRDEIRKKLLENLEKYN